MYKDLEFMLNEILNHAKETSHKIINHNNYLRELNIGFECSDCSIWWKIHVSKIRYYDVNSSLKKWLISKDRYETVELLSNCGSIQELKREIYARQLFKNILK